MNEILQQTENIREHVKTIYETCKLFESPLINDHLWKVVVDLYTLEEKIKELKNECTPS